MRCIKTVLFAWVGGVVANCGAASPPPMPTPEPETEPTVVEEEAPPPRDRGIQHMRDRRSGAVVRAKELKVAAAIEVGTNKAIQPQGSFHRGIRKVCASFVVSGLEEGGTIRVLWYAEGNLMEEHDIECEGEKRYGVCIDERKGIREGNYSVEVEVEGEVYAGRSFMVGGKNVSPVVDQSMLGTRVGKNRLPKKATKSFRLHTRAIHCGVRFLGLPDDAKVKVDWVFMGEAGEETVHTSETNVNVGGTANVALTWKPAGRLKSGNYRAVVYLGDQKMDELSFEVK